MYHFYFMVNAFGVLFNEIFADSKVKEIFAYGFLKKFYGLCFYI